MKRALGIGLIVAVIGGAFVAPPARADHHLVFISEVFLGTNGAADAQFVELTAFEDGQQNVEGASINLYARRGGRLQKTVFPANVATFDKGDSLIVGTPQAETLFGITADLEMPAQDRRDIARGGAACFVSDDPAFGFVDCVSWGNFSGARRGAGRPEHPSEGVITGASIGRTRARGVEGEYDSLDDSQDSRDDFSLRTPMPAGSLPSSVARIGFTESLISTPEEDVFIDVTLKRDNPTGDIQSASFRVLPGSAEAVQDFRLIRHREMTFSGAEGLKTTRAVVWDDRVFEGTEFVNLRVREPSAKAVLGQIMNARIRIDDIDDDVVAPISRITKPVNGRTYDADQVKNIRGRAHDPGPGVVSDVTAKIRRLLNDGTCQWWAGNRWIERGCSSGFFLEAVGRSKWRVPLPAPLKSSEGTNVRNYTIFSLAQDRRGNVESRFDAGRNRVTFEIE
jgi:hypothetical protein